MQVLLSDYELFSKYVMYTVYCSGTSFMYHKNMAIFIRDMFMQTYVDCVKNSYSTELWKCGVDQRLFTTMKTKNPSLFLKIGIGNIYRM